VGNILSDYARRRQISHERLAQDLSLTPSGLHYRLHAPDMSIHTLWSVCRALKHNFFLDLAFALPPFDDDRQSENEKQLQQQVGELQRTVDVLNIELNTYKNIIKEKA
jgi:hypothetical protein